MIHRLLKDEVRNRLTDWIVEGIVPPMEPLRIRSMAERLGVSTTPVREALLELEREGWITSSPNRGFSVKPLDPEEVRQLYPIIWSLEVHALHEDPPLSSDLDEMDRINRRMKDAEDGRVAVDLDTLWHDVLLSRGGNRILGKILVNLKRRASRYELAYMAATGRIAVSSEQHASISQHLREGRITEAARLLEENWRIGPEYLVPWLEGR